MLNSKAAARECTRFVLHPHAGIVVGSAIHAAEVIVVVDVTATRLALAVGAHQITITAQVRAARDWAHKARALGAEGTRVAIRVAHVLRAI